MANLEKIEIPIDIHSNIEKTFDFIDDNIPKNYSSEVRSLLPDDKKYALDYIRKVKTNRVNNAVIISYLYIVAKKYFDLKPQ
ncbi:hypothetical protein [Chryseobacterium luquanense]|uniref:Uncharacterized protein n=1 Tax=Chryseobacterium luquanense TaxID=2983766 RepID=A0ABT3Y4N5_9FLAO|nr:hypothetical protein [Chryseobacterium luquanense]MCX8533059.1 hypothetical protein [Chryseobacterium luquanense]